MLPSWSLVPLPFLKLTWTSESSQFTYYWSLVWRILSITLLVCEMMQLCSSLSILWHCLSLGLKWKLTFSSPVATAVFSTFACTSSFRIWNSSTGIQSPPLALFVVTLPKAHLTAHSRMSGFRWVITPLWLSESWRSFLYSSVYSCHLFLIPSASIRSIPLLSLYLAHLYMKCSPGISNFLEEISSLSHCVVFLYFFTLITERGFLISPYYSLKFYIQMAISFLFSFAFHFFSALFVRPPQTTILLFAFAFLGDGLDHCLLYNVTNLHP